jgi:nitroreductase
MELTEAMRTTGTCRYFRPGPVPDDVLRAAFARFAPQGGNRQPVRWIVVREQATRRPSPTSTCRTGRPTSARSAPVT